MHHKIACLLLLCSTLIHSQDYFYQKFQPFNPDVPSPEKFLGYAIGDKHTRHDLIVAYMEKLAEVSPRATMYQYGKTHEGRKLVILTLSSPENHTNLESIKSRHLAFTDPVGDANNYDEVPIFINLAYNVHGNEPSSSEAALLTAYTLAASESPEILNYLKKSVIFIDPAINPDGRDRHTQWANTYQAMSLVPDPQDAEHNEYWPGGRTNHYWFDLNRDWLLAVNPESQGKLDWYHEWYPNVVTDFHEMGSQSTYFFEPMKMNGSLNPIMPKENYEDLNNIFGSYFANALDSIGSLYFTKEVFDGTYPGYGSSYPDLQGGLGLLFEQASSRGIKQTTEFGEITFSFTIRNQYTSGIATVKAAVENKTYLREYQQDFFKGALTNASSGKIRGYRFGDKYDQNRNKAFIELLLRHRIEVHKSGENEFVVPVSQPQYRMVQTMFETYTKYRDSVFYDASAWSVSNFYNMKSVAVATVAAADPIRDVDELGGPRPVVRSEYAYLIDWDDYNAPAALYKLQEKGLVLSSSFKPFTAQTTDGEKNMGFGTLLLPVSLQKKSSDEIFQGLQEVQQEFQVPIYAVPTGYNKQGIDLGSGFIKPVKKPKAAMLIGTGVSSYEAGEVWHLLDTRVRMPITKLPLRNFNETDFDKYNVLVMVSGRYELTEKQLASIRAWVEKGNTLITIGTGSSWAVEKKLVAEKLVKVEKDSTAKVDRKRYIDAEDTIGKESVGGIILKVDLDITHPLAFGYHDLILPVYKNNEVWLAPSKNAYATVASYSAEARVDGYISGKNLTDFVSASASLMVSKLGSGRVILFADNPNFRGAWYGTNRLFLNALFLGNHIDVPE